VSGRREPPTEPGEAHYHRAEIYFGNFRRVVELPWEADAASIEANFKDGMLRVKVRRAPAPQVTDVPIEEGPGATTRGARERPR